MVVYGGCPWAGDHACKDARLIPGPVRERGWFCCCLFYLLPQSSRRARRRPLLAITAVPSAARGADVAEPGTK